MSCTFHVWLKIVLYFCTILEDTNKLITLLNKAISTVQTVLKDKPHQLHTVTAILTTRYYSSIHYYIVILHSIDYLYYRNQMIL